MKKNAKTTALDGLSPRERQVLKFVVEGRTSKEIAAIVGVKPSSIDTYRSRVMPAAARSRSRRRILLADDVRDTVLTLTQLLRQEGYEARGVYRGGDVTPAMQEFDPDVVLIEIAMPDRSGWDVAREIRAKHGPDRPVLVAISGVYRQAADQVLGKLGGFNYYIAKPCDPNVLLSLLRSVCKDK